MNYKNQDKVGMDLYGNLCNGKFICNLCGEEIKKDGYFTIDEFANKYANYDDHIETEYLFDLQDHLLKSHGKEINDGVDKWDGKERCLVLRDIDKWDLIVDVSGNLDIGAYLLTMIDRDNELVFVTYASNVKPSNLDKTVQRLIADKEISYKNIEIRLNKDCNYCIVYKVK